MMLSVRCCCSGVVGDESDDDLSLSLAVGEYVIVLEHHVDY